MIGVLSLDPLHSTFTRQDAPVFSMSVIADGSYRQVSVLLALSAVPSAGALFSTDSVTMSMGDCRHPDRATGKSSNQWSGPFRRWIRVNQYLINKEINYINVSAERKRITVKRVISPATHRCVVPRSMLAIWLAIQFWQLPQFRTSASPRRWMFVGAKSRSIMNASTFYCCK